MNVSRSIGTTPKRPSKRFRYFFVGYLFLLTYLLYLVYILSPKVVVSSFQLSAESSSFRHRNQPKGVKEAFRHRALLAEESTTAGGSVTICDSSSTNNRRQLLATTVLAMTTAATTAGIEIVRSPPPAKPVPTTNKKVISSTKKDAAKEKYMGFYYRVGLVRRYGKKQQYYSALKK